MLAQFSLQKLMYRDDFASLIFLIIAGLIALIFITFLIVDYIKNFRSYLERKKQLQHDHKEDSRP